MILPFHFMGLPYSLDTESDVITSNQGYGIPRSNASQSLQRIATQAKIDWLRKMQADHFRSPAL